MKILLTEQRAFLQWVIDNRWMYLSTYELRGLEFVLKRGNYVGEGHRESSLQLLRATYMKEYTKYLTKKNMI